MQRIIWSSLIISLLWINQINAQTWATDVAPILFSKCGSCHNPGGVGHYSLLTFEDAFYLRYSIQDKVVTGKMPPWPPDTTYNRLAHERILSQQEIQTISSWVDNGAASGDLSIAPQPPVYNNGPELLDYDLELTMPTYTVNTVSDLYRCFVLPPNLTQDKMISALEVIPGNKNIVHHVLVFSDTTHQAAAFDAADLEPGYTNFGGIGTQNPTLLAGWVPGSTAMKLPTNFGIKLFANADVVIQIHYPSAVFNQADSTKIRIKFASSTTGIRQVNTAPILNHVFGLTDGPLVIPPNTTKTFHETYTIPAVNVSVLSVAPHMHLIGRKIVAYAVSPAQDSIPFIRINDWDFHWQGFYNFKKVVKIPASSTLWGEAFYDNTTANPFNPANPPQTVSLGEGTNDEMFLVYFQYTPYYPGDENIVIDSSDFFTGTQEFDFSDKIKTLQVYEPYPNPAGSNLFLDFYNPSCSNVQLRIRDLNGKILLSEMYEDILPGVTTKKFNVETYSRGTYLFELESNGLIRSKTWIKE
ncbi:MAG: T9SS type A sorting domain-containing protein [Bacteroidia bacterium]|nr:T9SS type A sorting domain-containing protein [Bacteroidia bacterium]